MKPCKHKEKVRRIRTTPRENIKETVCKRCKTIFEQVAFPRKF